jgi:23S rRNA (guanosine2251-2'-O)-methyltransferase
VLDLLNPHSALAALKRRPLDVIEIRVGAQPSGTWKRVAELANEHRIPVVQMKDEPVQVGRRGKPGGGHSERAGVASARVREFGGIGKPEQFFKQTGAPGSPSGGKAATGATPGVWLALDHLTDPHNVGAIFRTASFFGVRGIILTRDRSAPLTATVFDVAAGGVEHVPFCIVSNLARALEEARNQGLWLLGTSEHAKDSLFQAKLDRDWLVIVGNEEAGLRRLTIDNCDIVAGIPSLGETNSLNVSVATAVVTSHLTSGAGKK